MKKLDYSQPKIITRTALLAIVILAVVLSLLTSCSGTYYIVEQPQHNCELMERGQQCLSDHRCCEKRDHSTEVYYYNDLPYWGFYNDYYYYYGIPHMYPWWYYYTLMPHYTYSVHTHVSIHCNNGYYVNKPRGTRFNNKRGGTYKPNTVIVKPRNNIRTNIKTNTNRTNIKVNTNRTNVKTNVKTNVNKNTNRTNIKVNRTNVKVNTNKNNVKVNTNRNNVKTKVNRRKPR